MNTKCPVCNCALKNVMKWNDNLKGFVNKIVGLKCENCYYFEGNE